MARGKRSLSLAVLSMVVAALHVGCGGGGGDPSGPALGEEVDLSLYEPADYQSYRTTYRITTADRVREASMWFHDLQPVSGTDPVTGNQVVTDCMVFEMEGETGSAPNERMYLDGRYLVGVKTLEAGRWGPLYTFNPRRQLVPEENPRINSTFDSGISSVTAIVSIFGNLYRDVRDFRTWKTYLAVEDSVTVPAGTFYDVLRTRVRDWVHLTRTAYPDTMTTVSQSTSDNVFYVWEARGIGTIKVQSASSSMEYEKVLISARVDGVTYPR